MQKTATSLTVLLVLAGGIAHANLITNGGFETTTPAVASGGFLNFIPGATGLTGWTVVGNAGTEVSAVNTNYVSECCSFPAEEGNNWLDLTGDTTNNDTEGVQQTIATTIGDNYSLSFYVGNTYDPRGVYGTTSTVDVFANTTSLGAFTNSCTTCTSKLTWQPFTTSFTATTTSITLKFLNGDPANDNSNGLDNIIVLDNGPVGTTPEPGSLALAGLAVLFLAVRRRVTL